MYATVYTVREVVLSHSARRLTRLARVDYSDAFLLWTPRAHERTGEGWARAMLEDAPVATRRALRAGWSTLGIALGSTADPERVLGWPVRRSSSDHALLAADSLVGMEAELLFKREEGGMLFATILKFNNPAARAVWAATTLQHRRVVRRLLEQAGRRLA